MIKIMIIKIKDIYNLSLYAHVLIYYIIIITIKLECIYFFDWVWNLFADNAMHKPIQVYTNCICLSVINVHINVYSYVHVYVYM